MKVAARFPVKDCLSLKWAILLVHLSLIFTAAYVLKNYVWITVIFFTTFVSYYFSIKHYRSITSASDDLCWTGEQWVMQGLNVNARSVEQSRSEQRFLQLLPTSWLSGFATLLHLSDGAKTHYWLFTRSGLGERAFRELNYLARQNLVAQLAESKK